MGEPQRLVLKRGRSLTTLTKFCLFYTTYLPTVDTALVREFLYCYIWKFCKSLTFPVPYLVHVVKERLQSQPQVVLNRMREMAVWTTTFPRPKGPSINDVGNWEGSKIGQNCQRIVLKNCRHGGGGVTPPRMARISD